MYSKPLTSLLFVLLATISSHSSAVVSTQTAAPDFTLKSNQGSNMRLNELQGEVVMINFWASWCGPCRKEMPLLNSLYEKYQDLGFTILGVNVEADATKANKIISDLGVNFPILYDNNSDVSKKYGVDSMPATVVVDRDGKVRYVHRGYKSGDEEKYRDVIKALVRE